MAHPKRRWSKSRQGKHRKGISVTQAVISKCKKCGAVVKSHHACPECGFYRDREIITIKKEEKKEGE